jgi:hypothetical protein
VTYRAELSSRVLKQIHGLPNPAFDSIIEVMAKVIDYPDDPLRTFPTSDPYVRRVEFGDAGLITYLIDAGLITYLINDGARLVIILDITWPVSSSINGQPLAGTTILAR